MAETRQRLLRMRRADGTWRLFFKPFTVLAPHDRTTIGHGICRIPVERRHLLERITVDDAAPAIYFEGNAYPHYPEEGKPTTLNDAFWALYGHANNRNLAGPAYPKLYTAFFPEGTVWKGNW